jgi:cytochrome c553
MTAFHRAAALFVVVVCSDLNADESIQFNRDIRPILIETCSACHGPDSASRKADLRLDQRSAAIDAGAISPGKPEESELIRRIMSDDPKEIMPPPELKKSLSDDQKKLLVDWIRSGAEYQQHWSYIPPTRAAVPAVPESVRTTLADWPKNPIDNFVLRKLVAAGLKPAAEADRRALARRVSFDITGLPPKLELVESFVRDSSPNAYETLVDTLLASPSWGEHRGRYWLDYARYADTHGIHFDNYREIWAYRAWVIRAFNQNMPYDQFTIENLAGDLLPQATLDQKIASGFNRCNMTTNEGGIIDEEYAVLYTRDRTETVSAVWMGLTANCATCHNHKFDQLSQKEFYELSAFFNNTTQPVRDGNIKDTPPIIAVPLDSDRARFEALPPLISSARMATEARRTSARPEFETWLAAATPETLGEPVSSEGLHLLAGLNEGEGKVLNANLDGDLLEVALHDSASWQEGLNGKAIAVQGAACEIASVGDFEGDQSFSCAAWINVPANDGSGAICARMEAGPGYRGWDFWMQQRRIGMHLINAWPQTGLKAVSKAQIPANEWVHVAVTYDGSRKASGLQIYINGVVQEKNVENDTLDGSTIRTETSWRVGSRSAGEPFTGAIQDLRIQKRVVSAVEVDALAKLSRFQTTLAKAQDQRSDQELNDLYGYWLKTFDSAFVEQSETLARLEKEEADIRARGTIAYVMNERSEPATAFVLNRGEYDQRREQVSPGTPAELPPFPEGAPRNRLGFAQWLLRPEHPLTARVTVNRFWQEIFGTGIVRTTGDLGVSGELPSDQELLDWLAVEFRESGWDVKKLFKLIVMSATYRQSTAVTPEKLEKDPANRLLSRGPRYRMDAEMVRDNALAVSGLLVPRIGGPSVKPYQPDGVWESIAMNGSTTSRYVRDSGENLYRRSLYTFVKRMAPPASLDIFNSPNREQCTIRRERTNTPLQALVTMNDEQFVEAARRLAENLLKSDCDNDEQRLQLAALRVLSREFRADELPILTASLAELMSFYRDHAKESEALIRTGESKPDSSLDVGTLAAWTMLCNEIMNLDEVLNK